MNKIQKEDIFMAIKDLERLDDPDKVLAEGAAEAEAIICGALLVFVDIHDQQVHRHNSLPEEAREVQELEENIGRLEAAIEHLESIGLDPKNLISGWEGEAVYGVMATINEFDGII